MLMPCHPAITKEPNMKLTDEIKRMLNGLAFANAGENLTSRQKHKVLAAASATPAQSTAPAHVPVRPQVALYLGSELSPDVMQYLEQTCVRLRHGLTVLTLQSEEDTRALLAPYQPQLDEAGIEVRLVTLSGDPPTALAHALHRRTEVAFLVCNESGYFGHGVLGSAQRNGGIPVPVVLIAAKDSAAIQPPQTTEVARIASARAA